MSAENNSNELTLMDVKMAVYSWSIRFREAGYANEQLARISQEFFEDLVSEGVTKRQFQAAVMAVRKRCRFFPKMCDILEAVCRYRERPPEQKPTAAPQIEDVTSCHDLTPEEIEKNKARVKAITDMLAGRITMEEAIGQVEDNTHIKEFGKR